MEECFECGISGERALLFDAISDHGIIKICKKCSFDESIPIIRKPSVYKFRETEKKQSVYERLSRSAGIDPNKALENKRLQKQEASLRQIVDKNFKTEFKEAKTKDDLIDNFHWILMRARRSKKITQAQLAEKIGESEVAVHMAEKGALPDPYQPLIKKFENYLGIKLLKKEFVEPKKPPAEVVDAELLGKPQDFFKGETPKLLTISDLAEMKKKKEEAIFDSEEIVFNEEILGEEEREDKPEFVEKKEDSEDISQEDIDKIIFGK